MAYKKGGGTYRAPAGSQGESPDKRVVVREIATKPPGLRDVVEHYRQAELRPLWLGRVSHLWVADQDDRAKALKELKAALVADDLATAAGRVDRFIHVYWVARLFGEDDAQQLRVAALRELCPLVRRNAANEEYAIRKNCDRAARALWNRMRRNGLSAAAVREEVLKILPKRTVKMKATSAKLDGWLKAVPQLGLEEARTLIARLVEHCERLTERRLPAA